MPAAPYIPPKDADLKSWLENFIALTSADPALYGLTGGDAAAIAAAGNPAVAAITVALNKPTRTPTDVLAKNNLRAAALQVIRPFAQAIRGNTGVTNDNKLALRLNLANNAPSPIPAPVTFPVLAMLGATPLQHTLRFADSSAATPRGKKPFGALNAQLWVVITAVGVPVPTDPLAGTMIAVPTKNPITVTFASGDVGKVATYFARWVTRTGLLGPWSVSLSMVIAGTGS